MRIPLLIVLALGIASTVRAEPNIEDQKKNSFLALSAFECAVVSPNDKEGERLFMLGYKSGLEFLQFIQSNTALYLKSIKSEVPLLWNLTAGPTPDFILGRIYADRQHEIYKEFTPDAERWKLKKQNIYRAKNCALVGKP